VLIGEDIEMFGGEGKFQDLEWLTALWRGGELILRFSRWELQTLSHVLVRRQRK
jgi:hypothetical protein